MSRLDLGHQTIQHTPRVVSIRIVGEVDAGIDLVETYFDEVLRSEQPRHILLDLNGLTFAGSPFFGTLLFWKEKMEKGNGRLVLFGVQPEVAYVLHLCSLDRMLTICSDQQAALAALVGG